MEARDQQALSIILEAARWAVSADNGQPWKFHWRESRLFVLLDSSHASSFFDRRQYAPYIGLGSLLENISIAARHIGYEPDVDLLPDQKSNGEQVVASVSFLNSLPQANALYPAILERTTNRRPYQRTAISPEARTALTTSSEEFADFRIVLVDESSLKRTLATLTAGAEAVRFDFSRKEVHSDLFKCLRFTRAQAQKTGDGLWIRCLEPGVPGTLALRILAKWPIAAVASRLGVHRALSRLSVQLLGRTPTVVLIISPLLDSRPDQRDFLRAGRLSQRLWLTATVHHLACQPMAALPLFFLQHACFGDEGFPGQAGRKIGKLREEFNKTFNLADGEHLLMLYRLGYAKPPSARSFRRPVQELLRFSDNSPIVSPQP